MKRAIQRPTLNPVLVREMRARFRGPRAFIALTLFLAVMTVVTMVTYGIGYVSSTARPYYNQTDFGDTVFTVVVLFQGILLGLMAPAFTFGLLSGERDRGTWELLLATPLSGWRIIAGKMGAVTAFGLLLMAGVLPMLGMAFVLGGVSPGSVLLSQIAILSGAAMLAAIGLGASAIARTTSRAASLAYLGAALFIAGPFILLVVVEMLPWSYASNGSGLEIFVSTALQFSPVMMLLTPTLLMDYGSWDQAQWIGQQVLLQTVITGWFLFFATARVRGSVPKRGGLLSATLLLLGMLSWAIWRAAETVSPF